MLGAVGLAAAVGYGVYSLASGKDAKPDSSDDFQDAIEEENEEDARSPVVKVALHPTASTTSSKTDHQFFL